ncbi:CDP-glucose 4,6-dehydratase [Streptomyces sp. NPDC056987]|uniref:CDP-glucose 4,6-dehydratase n=1 Tax=Streptomyces sp. NPDC056987 TaxID=3345988 RepID=UPI003631165F
MARTDLTAHPAARPRVPADTWRGQRVLVSGHSGFVGSWLTTALLSLGAEVSGFALNGDRHSRDRDAALTTLGATATTGDVRDFAAVHRAMSARPFDVVFHLAAQPLVSVGLSEPGTTLATNVGGSINVLEAARLCPPTVLVHVTSDKCYRNEGWRRPYREVDALGAGCPYSTSKAAAELVFETYAGLFRAADRPVRAASVRFGNIIGGGDHAANRLVPDVMRALRAQQPVRLRRPGAVRPWQHVLDVVAGLLLLATALAEGSVGPGEVFNFAPPGDGATVHELVTSVVAAWRRSGGPAVPVLVDEDAWFAEAELLRLDGRKAADALCWTHSFGLEDSARAIVEWDRAVAAGLPPADAISRQVHGFLIAPVPSPQTGRRKGDHS